MSGIAEALESAAKGENIRRYCDLFRAMATGVITLEEMNAVCVAIGRDYKEEGEYKTTRPVPHRYNGMSHAQRLSSERAEDQNYSDKVFIEYLDRFTGELTERAKAWRMYVQEGTVLPEVAGVLTASDTLEIEEERS